MAKLEISAALRSSEHVVGCSLPVEVTIGSGAEGRELSLVPAAGSPVPFEYVLESARHGTVVASKALFDQARDVHGTPPPAVDATPLKPGELATYLEDVAAVLVAPLAVGDWALRVAFVTSWGERIESSPVPLTITPAQPGAVAAGVGLNGQKLTTAFVNSRRTTSAAGATVHGTTGPSASEDVNSRRTTSAAGATVHGTTGPSASEDVNAGAEWQVVVRDAEYGRPDLGFGRVFHRTAAQVSGIAVATEIDDAVPWRFVAWLEGDALRAAIVWGDERIKLTDPSPHGLAGARLLPVGWQNGGGAGLFVLVGTHAGHEVASLALVPASGPLQHHTFPLPGPPLGAAAAGCWRQASHTVDLVAARPEGSGTAIDVHRLALGAPPSPPRRLLIERGRALAVSVAPVLDGHPVVDALFGDDAGPLTHHRAGLVGGQGEVLSLDPPPGAARAWSIPSVPHERRPVLAQVDDALYLAEAAGDRAWTPVARSAHGISHARLVHLAVPDGKVTGRLFSTWFDRACGHTVG